MDRDQAYFNCLLEEYRQSKNEIMALQRYQWRVQMFYVPTIILAFVGFYIKEVWTVPQDQVVVFEVLVKDLLADPVFLLLLLWSALISLMIVLYVGCMMVREQRYLVEHISPSLESLFGPDRVALKWEHVSNRRTHGSWMDDGTLEIYGVFFFGTLLLLLPISIAVSCIVQGVLLFDTMDELVKGLFVAAFVVAVVLALAGIIALVNWERRGRRTQDRNEQTPGEKDKPEVGA